MGEIDMSEEIKLPSGWIVSRGDRGGLEIHDKYTGITLSKEDVDELNEFLSVED